MIKKIVAAIMIIITILGLYDTELVYTEQQDWTKYSSKYFYNKMNSRDKKIWDKLEEMCLKYITTEVDADLDDNSYYYTEYIRFEGVKHKDVGNVFYIFLNNNGQYYFLHSGYIWHPVDNGVEIKFRIFDNYHNGKERMKATKNFKKYLNSYQRKIDKCKTVKEKIKCINKIVLEKLSYNYELCLEEDINKKCITYDLYNSLRTNKAICGGYSSLVSMLANYSDINAIVLVSKDHIWNKVKINGKWFNIDSTWQDTGGKDYFLITDKQVYNLDKTPEKRASHTPIQSIKKMVLSS